MPVDRLIPAFFSISFPAKRVRAEDLHLLSDESLVELSLSGDKKAYETIVRRFQKLVFNVLYQMTHSHERAADLTQETFIKAYRGLKGFRPGARLKPWILRIATNTCLNAIRDERSTDSLDEYLEDASFREPAASDNVEVEVDFNITQDIILKLLEELPARQRLVFLLRHHQDLSYDEIALAINESESAVKSLLFRARERLRKALATLEI